MREEKLKQREVFLLQTLAEIRKDKGFTQREICAIMDMKQPSLAKIERGLISPQLNTLLKILEPLGYTIAFQKIEKEQ